MLTLLIVPVALPTYPTSDNEYVARKRLSSPSVAPRLIKLVTSLVSPCSFTVPVNDGGASSLTVTVTVFVTAGCGWPYTSRYVSSAVNVYVPFALNDTGIGIVTGAGVP